MKERRFQVLLGNHLSDIFDQENGIVQGSVLNVTLFLVVINGLEPLTYSPKSTILLFADDAFLMCPDPDPRSRSRSKFMKCIQNQLQRTLNNIQNWSNKTGFSFSATKTSLVHFCRLRRAHQDPELYLNGERLPIHTELKFLGVTFDKALNWKPHIANLKKSVQPSLNLIRNLSQLKWNLDPTILLRLHNTLVLSKLDYGDTVYSSARASYLKTLDAIHHSGTRCAVGYYRTTPSITMIRDSGQLTLNEIRDQHV